MAKGVTLIQELDDALEAIMSNPDALLPPVKPRIDAILRIAGDLRDLPSHDFKRRLKARLLSASKSAGQDESASPSGGKPLFTIEDIEARLKEMAEEPRMVAHDIGAALKDLPEMSMRFLAPLNPWTLIVSRGSQPSHWERHPGGNELIYVVDGAAEVVTLTESGKVRSPIREGSIFICPKGLWHRIVPQPFISAFYLTPGEGTEGSEAEDPRRKDRARKSVRKETATGRKAKLPKLAAYDLREALSSVPELVITSNTTAEEADAAVRQVAQLDHLSLGVMRYQGLTPWERHPDGDELLFAIDGAVEVTVLTDDGPVHRTLRAGSAFVCPQGLWHRQLPRPAVSMLYGTPTETTEVSFADDPRSEP